MKEERILRYTLEEIENLPDDTDWERVDAMTDEEVMQAALSDKDAQPTDEAFWKDAVRALPENYLYVETDVLEWFTRVELTVLEHKGVPVIPADALLKEGEENFAYVVNGGKALKKKVVRG